MGLIKRKIDKFLNRDLSIEKHGLIEVYHRDSVGEKIAMFFIKSLWFLMLVLFLVTLYKNIF